MRCTGRVEEIRHPIVYDDRSTRELGSDIGYEWLTSQHYLSIMGKEGTQPEAGGRGGARRERPGEGHILAMTA
jgi:hypothetical protein